MLLEAVREEAEHDAVKLARAIERRAREEAQDKARDIIVTAMQRIAADHTAEHTVTVVHLPSDEMKGRIIGNSFKFTNTKGNITLSRYQLQPVAGDAISDQRAGRGDGPRLSDHRDPRRVRRGPIKFKLFCKWPRRTTRSMIPRSYGPIPERKWNWARSPSPRQWQTVKPQIRKFLFMPGRWNPGSRQPIR